MPPDEIRRFDGKPSTRALGAKQPDEQIGTYLLALRGTRHVVFLKDDFQSLQLLFLVGNVGLFLFASHAFLSSRASTVLDLRPEEQQRRAKVSS